MSSSSVRKYTTPAGATRWRWDVKDQGARRSKGGYLKRRDAVEGLERALKDLPTTLGSDTPLGEWLVRWLPMCADLSESSRTRYAKQIHDHLTPPDPAQGKRPGPASLADRGDGAYRRIGLIPLRDLNADHVAEWVAGMSACGYAPASVRLAHAVLSRALKDAKRAGHVGANVAQGTALPKRHEVEDVKHLTLEEQRALLAYLRDGADVDPRQAALYALLLTTGMRIGEALALRWRDVDLARGEVRIRGTYQGKASTPARGYPKVTVPKGKAGRSKQHRTVIAPEATLRLLEAWQAIAATQRVRNPLWAVYAAEAADAGQPDGSAVPVFTVPTGEVCDPGWCSKVLRGYCRALGIRVISPHGLRHSFATAALSLGIHPKVVSEALGHSTTQQTMETYSHAMPEHNAATAARIGAAMW